MFPADLPAPKVVCRKRGNPRLKEPRSPTACRTPEIGGSSTRLRGLGRSHPIWEARNPFSQSPDAKYFVILIGSGRIRAVSMPGFGPSEHPLIFSTALFGTSLHDCPRSRLIDTIRVPLLPCLGILYHAVNNADSRFCPSPLPSSLIPVPQIVRHRCCVHPQLTALRRFSGSLLSCIRCARGGS